MGVDDAVMVMTFTIMMQPMRVSLVRLSVGVIVVGAMLLMCRMLMALVVLPLVYVTTVILSVVNSMRKSLVPLWAHDCGFTGETCPSTPGSRRREGRCRCSQASR
jgi:hypothetical protein